MKEAKECAVRYFEGDELAAKVFLDKYAAEGEKTPDNMHQRLAYKISTIERRFKKDLENQTFDPDNLSDLGVEYVKSLKESNDYEIRDKWFQLFRHFKYIVPGGSIMASLGANDLVSLANCFGLGKLEDKMESIMDKGKEMSFLFMRRGGCGMSLDPLRPRGATVNNAAKFSTGAASFMDYYSTTCKTIGQDGRRGALMLAMSDRHPDVKEFILSKQDLSKVTGANISVKASKALIDAAQKDEDWLLKWPCHDPIEEYCNWKAYPYDELHDVSFKTDVGNYTGYIKKVKAKELLDLIIECAWKTAEPGILLWDNIINFDPSSVYKELKPVTTNPCGEVPLSDADSCRLSHINLLSFVVNPFTSEAYFDFELFRKVAYQQVIFLDDVIELECKNILNIIEKSDSESEKNLWRRVYDTAQKGRRIGCGFTALGDTIAAMNLAFKDSHHLVEGIMETKFKAELEASIDLGYLRGPFLSYDSEKEHNDWYEFLFENYYDIHHRMAKLGRRNVSLSTVAPVGSGSLLTQTTSGIEPIFKTFYTRRVKVNNFDEKYDFVDPNTKEKFREFIVAHKTFQKFCEIQTGKKFEDIPKGMINVLFKSSPYYKNEAADIDWKTRLEIQAIVQKYTTSSISTTINLPSNVEKDVVKNIYLNAYKMGLKGVTVKLGSLT